MELRCPARTASPIARRSLCALRTCHNLLAEEQWAASTPLDVALLCKMPEREFASNIEAVLLRLAWLDQHDAELENANLARIRLTALLRLLFSIKASHTEHDLRCCLIRRYAGLRS